MRKLLALVTVLAALLWVLPSPTALADTGGTVEGRVLNGTRDGVPLADSEVTLSFGPALELTARTDPQGRFRFQGLPLSADGPYTLRVDYAGVDYTLKDIYLSPGRPSAQVQMYVYDTTSSTESIQVLVDHHILTDRPEEQRLQVVNYIRLANMSDRTVVARRPASALPSFIPLPETAENARLLSLPAAGIEDAGAPAASLALFPGEHDLLVTYELPYIGNSVLFRERLDHPVQRLVFLIPEEGIRIEGDPLLKAKEVQIAAGSFEILSGKDIPAGTSLRLRVVGLPSNTHTSLLDLAPMALSVLALITLSVAAVAAYLRFRRRRQYPTPIP